MTTTPAPDHLATAPAMGLRRLVPFRTPVRGHAYAPAPRTDTALEPGVDVLLRREPGNPADPFAIAVEVVDAGGAPWRIGYLDRGVAARLAPRLDAGSRIVGRVDGWVPEPDRRWVRPLVLVHPEPEEDPDPADRARLWGQPPGVRRRAIARPGSSVTRQRQR